VGILRQNKKNYHAKKINAKLTRECKNKSVVTLRPSRNPVEGEEFAHGETILGLASK
jgi:hypothetical protein